MTLKSFNTLSGSNYKTWEEAYLNVNETHLLIPLLHLQKPHWISFKACCRHLSDNFIIKNKDKILWDIVSLSKDLSIDIIREFKDKLNWEYLIKYHSYSETFLREFSEKINFDEVAKCQIISESFIEEFSDKFNWKWISDILPLSEDFIRKHLDKINWDNISQTQNLSASFIREFSDKLDWESIVKYQKLSISFIKNYLSPGSYPDLIKYQQSGKDLVESMIISNFTLTDEIMYNAAKYQGICLDPFYQELADDCWLNKSAEFKKQQVLNTGLYECFDDYFIAYKGVRRNRCSLTTSKYRYLPNHTYESWCNASDDSSGHGLSAYYYGGAYMFSLCEKAIKVKIFYKDVGRVEQPSRVIRCFKFEVLD